LDIPYNLIAFFNDVLYLQPYKYQLIKKKILVIHNLTFFYFFGLGFALKRLTTLNIIP